jgi:ubiquinone/menaquinone biosynthesis C-methylase UbiE
VLGATLAERLHLRGGETLLDVGCGPGPLVLALGSFFGQVEAVDPDKGMLDLATHRALVEGVTNVRWHRCRAEEMPEDITDVTVATFGQSFLADTSPEGTLTEPAPSTEVTIWTKAGH